MNESQVFTHVLKLATPAEREAYLEAACAGDPGLRAAVEELLRAQAGDPGFLEQPAASLSVTADAPAAADRPTATAAGPMDQAGAVLAGRYKLLEPIGEGGMGTVWMAEQREPVKRLVAVKLIKPGMDSRQVLARFEAERQALAMMDHPNIAKVHDAGVAPDGRPFFVMELVKGVPITKYCDDHRLTPRQRLELFVPVCQAVQHAHQKGVIHRDLKPSNVLVALYDGRPVPKVIDFGVAKATGQQLTEQTLHTGFGAVVGTVEYMSPEQATFNQLDVDTRSDIYSLGVLLYELLAGSPPFSKKELERAGMLEMLRVIREQEPSKPSTKLSTADGLPTLAANRGTEPARLTRLMRGELDWIVMKSLEKDRSRRYETANGFAADVQRYLSDETVQACPPSAGYRLRKFARRNRRAVMTAAAVLFVLVAGIAGTTFGLIRAEHRRAEAEQARSDEAAQRQVADAQKKKAEQAEADTLADYRASTDDAVEQLIGSKADLGPQERAYLEKTLKRWQAFAARQGNDERSQAIRAEGHHRVALLWAKLGQRDAARPEYETARELYKKLAEAFPAVPDYRHELARTQINIGFLLFGLGQREAARTELETARDLQQKLVAAFPAVPEYQQKLAIAHYGLGTVLRELGQRDAARTEYQTARDLQKKLADAFPAVPQYQSGLATTHIRLGNLLLELGRRDAARAEFETARDLYKKLADAFPAVPGYQDNLAVTHNNLGNVLQELAQRDAARAQFETSRDLHKELADAFPAVPRYQQELATTHNNLGNLLKTLGKDAAARAEYETARDLQRKLAAAFPAVPEYQQELARTHNNLGNLLFDLGQRDAARPEYETARELYKKLAEAFPAVPEYQVDLGGSFADLGNLVRDEGQPADSLHWYDLAIRTLKPVYEKDTRAVRARLFLRSSHVNRATAYAQLKKNAEAVEDWHRAIDLDPKNAAAHYELAWRLTVCSDLKLREPKQALVSARLAVQLDPKNGMYWQGLGYAEYRSGNWKAAILAFEKLKELGSPGDSMEWFPLAMAHWQLGDKDTARKIYGQAVQWREKNNPRDEFLLSLQVEAAKLMGIEQKKE